MMIKKILDLLGEELSKQVTEKLGDVELAIMNDGSVVPADKHDTLKKEMGVLEKKYDTDIAEVNGKLEDTIKNAKDYDGLKLSLENLKTENDKSAAEHKTAMEIVKKNLVLEVALTKGNVKDGYLEMIKSTVDLTELTFDGDTLKGLEELIKAKQEQFPDLFGEIKIIGTTQTGTKENPKVGNRADLIKQYEEAEKSGNVGLMMQYDKKIKALPKEE